MPTMFNSSADVSPTENLVTGLDSNEQQWLETFPNHPIFVPPESYKEQNQNSCKKQSFITFRSSMELIVAIGSELRIAHLGEIKSKKSTSYKVLNTPEIDFDIVKIVPSAQEKYLAVFGEKRAAVLALPRRGWSGLVGTRIGVKCLQLGQFYHGLASSPNVVQALWHPYGNDDTTILILTADGILREYDVSVDAEDPVQTTDFCSSGEHGANSDRSRRFGSISGTTGSYGLGASTSSTSTSFGGRHFGLSAADSGDNVAVSFAIGDSHSDWSALTIFCLFQNGDIFSICPYIPKSANYPTSYFASLTSLISQKLETAQTCRDQGINVEGSSYSATDDVERYRQQLNFVNTLVRKGESNRTSKSSWQDINGNSVIRLRNIESRKRPIRQGPYLLQPAPKELDDDNETFATDLSYIAYQTPQQQRQQQQQKETTAENSDDDYDSTLGVFVIAYSNGKIDVAIETQVVEPRWNVAPVEGDQDLPAMFVYETIDLGLVTPASDEEAEMRKVQILKDPVYKDTVYASHNFGTHALEFCSWLDPLYKSIFEDDVNAQKSMDNLILHKQMSQVTNILMAPGDDDTLNPPTSVSVINSPLLDYILVMLTPSLQLVSVELNLRIPSSKYDEESESTSTKNKFGSGNVGGGGNKKLDTESAAYIPLLTNTFIPPPILGGHQTSQPKIALPANLAGKGPITEQNITPEHLRFLGEAVQNYRTTAKDIANAANVVQDRLELQLREYSRQVGKIEEYERVKKDEYLQSQKLASRISDASARQRTLLSRLDKVLQRLFDQHQPELSYYEQQWFEELQRTLNRVVGDRAGTGRSLQARVDRIEEQFNILNHELTAVKLTQSQSQSQAQVQNKEFGKFQLEQIQDQLGDESQLIATTRQKLDKLYRQISTLNH